MQEQGEGSTNEPDTSPASEAPRRDVMATDAFPPADAVPEWIVLRATTEMRRLKGWELVLHARGIRPRWRFNEGAFELLVSPEQAVDAEQELRAAERDDLALDRARRADEAIKDPPESANAMTGSVLLGLFLLAFFGITGPRDSQSWWFAAGASDAARVLHGEWWRTITGLSLHADIAHVVSNVALGSVVVGFVMRSLGVGFGGLLVLLSGALGNAINAWARQSHHSTVGFSTAVFGAVGILGGLGYLRARRRLLPRVPPWTAIGVSLALLGLFGASEESDVLAHLFGAIAGLVLALGVGASGVRWTSRAAQVFGGSAAVALVVFAWWFAAK